MLRATLPPRLWVVGPCGSGKSTVASHLAARLGIEPTHLDEIHWRPGWIEASPEEEKVALARALAAPSWVVDGNYGTLGAPHRDLVDLFVWLDLPLTVTWPRLLRRALTRSLLRRPCCNGNYESLWRTFFDRESLLLYALQTHTRRRTGLERELGARPHVRLRTPGAVAQWMRKISAGERSGRS